MTTVEKIAQALEADQARRAEEERKARELHEAAVAGSPEATAARLLGAKVREVEKVTTWGSRSIVTMRGGARRVLVPPDDPDGAGRYGVMTLDVAVPKSATPHYVPRPGERVPLPNAGPLGTMAAARWGRRPKPEGPPPEEVAAEAEKRERAKEARARARLEVLRGELAEVDLEIAEGVPGATERRDGVARDLRRAEAVVKSWDGRRNPPPPDPREVRFHRGVLAACRALLAARTPLEEREVRLSVVDPRVNAVIDKPINLHREIAACSRWLAGRNLAEVEEGTE